MDEATLRPIRILAKEDKIWILDPNPNVVWNHGGIYGYWGENHYVNWNGNQGNVCNFLHILGRMFNLFHFFNIPFPWGGKWWDIECPIGRQQLRHGWVIVLILFARWHFGNNYGSCKFQRILFYLDGWLFIMRFLLGFGCIYCKDVGNVCDFYG
mgnify:CR=1 FL=1